MAKEEKEIETPIKTGKTYSVTFTQNRSFEVSIGKKFFKFEPHQTISGFTADDINHSDFKQQSEYFIIKEQ